MNELRGNVLAVIGPPKNGKSTALRDAAKQHAERGLRVCFIDAELSQDALDEVFEGTRVRAIAAEAGKSLYRALPSSDSEFDVLVVDYAAILKSGFSQLAELAHRRNITIITAAQAPISDNEACPACGDGPCRYNGMIP